jgi:CheY-like chemotaxis protein
MVPTDGAEFWAGAHFNATILLVDDDPVLRNLVHRVLRHGGYNVITGSGAPEALTIAECHDEPIQLLLTDVEMPGMNGFELMRRLRLERPELKVLFMSGSTKAAAVSDHPFLSKPFTLVQLLTTVRKVLNS